MINFLDGKYYIKISSHDNEEATQDIISNITTDLVKSLSVSSDFPAELKLFPEEGKIANSEGYINISFLSYEFLKKAFTCNYGTPEKQFKLFIIHASTDDEARKILSDYLKFAKQEFNGTEGRYTVKDPYNGDIPLEWKGKYIWGIVNDKKVKIKPDYIQLIQNRIENSASAM